MIFHISLYKWKLQRQHAMHLYKDIVLNKGNNNNMCIIVTPFYLRQNINHFFVLSGKEEEGVVYRIRVLKLFYTP